MHTCISRVEEIERNPSLLLGGLGGQGIPNTRLLVISAPQVLALQLALKVNNAPRLQREALSCQLKSLTTGETRDSYLSQSWEHVNVLWCRWSVPKDTTEELAPHESGLVSVQMQDILLQTPDSANPQGWARHRIAANTSGPSLSRALYVLEGTGEKELLFFPRAMNPTCWRPWSFSSTCSAQPISLEPCP